MNRKYLSAVNIISNCPADILVKNSSTMGYNKKYPKDNKQNE
jgi:hypothetical protein